MSQEKSYVMVGASGRATASFLSPMLKNFKGRVKVLAIMDINIERAKACNILEKSDIPVYDDFDKMMQEVNPDAVYVCSVDATHAQYVVKALELGKEVYSEKPLCTTYEQVQDIRKAFALNNDSRAFVTHNMRYTADLVKMKEVISAGGIGDVLYIQFIEYLDRFHGADYFRRWHGKFKNSGGLTIHKASHHFDLINWLADSKPISLSAHGRSAFYGKNGKFRGNRCSDCEHTEECKFYADVFENQTLKTLYQDVESVDGYLRDGCVFDEEIDVEDTINASFTYENGIEACYSLIAYGSYEGMNIIVEGTEGRLEYIAKYGTSWAVGGTQKDAGLGNDGDDDSDKKTLTLIKPYAKKVDITQAIEKGGHGGADPKLQEMLYGGEDLEDPYGCKADLEEGIQAVLLGLATNKSMRNGASPVNVQTNEFIEK